MGNPSLNAPKLNEWNLWSLTRSILVVVKITSKLTRIGQTLGWKTVINEICMFHCFQLRLLGSIKIQMGVSKNNGTPKSSIKKLGFSIIFTIHLVGFPPILGNIMTHPNLYRTTNKTQCVNYRFLAAKITTSKGTAQTCPLLHDWCSILVDPGSDPPHGRRIIPLDGYVVNNHG